MKPITKAASTVMIALLLAPISLPLASAFSHHQDSLRLLGVSESGNTITETLMVNGTLLTTNATISYPTSTDPTIYWPGNSLTYPTYIGNTPYSWWTGISKPPEFYLYIAPNFALDSQTGVEASVVLLGGLGAIASPLGAAVGAVVGGLIALEYTSLYSGGHSPDNSLTIWIPADWYNLDVSLGAGHYITLATPQSWWVVTALGSYITGSR